MERIRLKGYLLIDRPLNIHVKVFDGREIFKKLVKTADVVIESIAPLAIASLPSKNNFSPGASEVTVNFSNDYRLIQFPANSFSLSDISFAALHFTGD